MSYSKKCSISGSYPWSCQKFITLDPIVTPGMCWLGLWPGTSYLLQVYYTAYYTPVFTTVNTVHFQEKTRFLLISASYPHHLSLGWRLLSEHDPGLPYTTNLILLAWPDPEPQFPHRALRAGVTAAKAFLCLPCVLPSNIALIPQLIIPAQWKGKLPLTKSDLINNFQFFLTMLKKIYPQLKEKRFAVKSSDGSSRGMPMQVLKFYLWPVLVCVWDFLDDRFVVF